MFVHFQNKPRTTKKSPRRSHPTQKHYQPHRGTTAQRAPRRGRNTNPTPTGHQLTRGQLRSRN